MQLGCVPVVFLCCLAAVVRGAPASGRQRQKMLETQEQLRFLVMAERWQLDETSSLNIETGCHASALECFRGNVLNLTVTNTEKKKELCLSLTNSKIRAAARHLDAGNATCQSCESFPKTANQLMGQLTMFLQKAMTSLSA